MREMTKTKKESIYMDGPAAGGVALKRRGRMPLLLVAMLALGLMATALVACSSDKKDDGGSPTNGPTAASTDASTAVPNLSGDIDGDGSSTVYPITEAVAEEFGKKYTKVRVTAGIAGTGGGFEKFCNGETDFNDASRPIKDTEAQKCADAGIQYTEFQVAFDGLAVVTNPSNDFVDCLTVAELKKIWEPAAQDTITNWNQVRDGFPDKSLNLFGPGTDSGTFDYFTEVINGKQDDSRGDYQASEDDNTLVQGVAGDEGGLGYFGLAYYEENTDKLKLLGVDSGTGCVEPSKTTVLDGTYKPLSRPLFIYFTNDALARREVQEFVRYYLTEGQALVEEVGYVKATDEIYQQGLSKLP
jgi:phosphate transport system substrate-binding protein